MMNVYNIFTGEPVTASNSPTARDSVRAEM